jgi:Mg-chelatase subunit ChlI
MLKTGRTIAAFHHRKEVTSDDIREAAELVLPHRMRRKPFQEPKIDSEKLEDAIRNHNNQPQSQQQPSGEQHEPKKKTMNLMNGRADGPTAAKK